MTKKRSMSEVSLTEIIAIRTLFTNDASNMRLQLSFNTTSLFNLEGNRYTSTVLFNLMHIMQSKNAKLTTSVNCIKKNDLLPS